MTAEYFFTPFVLLFLPRECHDEFFVDFNFLHGNLCLTFDSVTCLKIAVSKALGVGIIFGSMIVKVPQIVKLVRARSGAGLSVMGLFSDLVVITSTVAYALQKDFPFSSWGESLFMALQNGILVMLIWFYNNNNVGAMLFPPVYCGVSYLLFIAPLDLVVKLQQFNLLFLAAARLLQIRENISNGHTGQLSLITTILLSAGSLARVFTSLQETGDLLLTSQFIVSSSLNCVILAQMFWYWSVTSEVEKKKKAK